MNTTTETTIQEIQKYHETQAKYCRMVWRQSWGRSRGFKQTWKDRERFHRRAAKQLNPTRKSAGSGRKL